MVRWYVGGDFGRGGMCGVVWGQGWVILVTVKTRRVRHRFDHTFVPSHVSVYVLLLKVTWGGRVHQHLCFLGKKGEYILYCAFLAWATLEHHIDKSSSRYGLATHHFTRVEHASIMRSRTTLGELSGLESCFFMHASQPD
ncbi:hypothetical protein CC86DRAFT_18105 [Ophiobolus disseminans]|uniref:Uncharacterized protein n=1 Tax=Ophiobolus disseminans TaxID=1469910 RepID=A0A6A7ALI6_9PLEO|nr:hypothetical protein CC86DRAFT_18105 [Ophiobolus disseminans]